jgi:hypothetical protein
MFFISEFIYLHANISLCTYKLLQKNKKPLHENTTKVLTFPLAFTTLCYNQIFGKENLKKNEFIAISFILTGVLKEAVATANK